VVFRKLEDGGWENPQQWLNMQNFLAIEDFWRTKTPGSKWEKHFLGVLSVGELPDCSTLGGWFPNPDFHTPSHMQAAAG